MFDLKIKVLIIDDMPTVRKAVCKNCKDIGFTDLTEASDGIDGWDKISNAKPSFDLIISDCEMPNCTGLDLLKRVRRDSRFKNIPFVLLVSESESKELSAALHAGVNDCIVKPFSAQVLHEKLEQVHTKFLAQQKKA